MRRGSRWIRGLSIAIALAVVVAAAWLITDLLPLAPGTAPDATAEMARWPWPEAVRSEPWRGVTHWLDRSSPDGTVLDLLEFDFEANPGLRLELYDQDEDDAEPFDNNIRFWRQSVGPTVRHLQEIGRRPIVAAWNGAFFNYPAEDEMENAVAHHLAPVVLRGEAHYNVGTHRWAVGVRYEDGAPVFSVRHEPSIEELEQTYAFAAVSAQCLIREERPLRLEPFPEPDDPPVPQPVASSPREAGHIPIVDHMRTSRTSMAWSRDNRKLWLLIVKEPDWEGASIRAWHRRIPLMGGWTVADLQRFWEARGAWGAVNLDGGEITQMAVRRQDGGYTIVPARQLRSPMRMGVGPGLEEAPEGSASVMYFYVKDQGE